MVKVPRFMRIAVISDIHSNADALKAVLKDIDRQDIARTISLGDNIGYGAEPEEVLDILIGRNISSVLGNHELGVVDPSYRDWFNPSAKKALLRTLEMLSERSLRYISKLPTHMVWENLRFVHGFPPDSVTTYLFQISNLNLSRTLNSFREKISFVGHTHTLEVISAGNAVTHRVPEKNAIIKIDDENPYIINTGSVGQPRDGDIDAKYIVYDMSEKTVEARFVPYDNKAAAEKIYKAGIPRQYGDRLL